MKRFRLPRPVDPQLRERLVSIDPVRGKSLAKNLEQSLIAIPLVAHEALTTAYINDVDGYGVFAQQLLGFGRAAISEKLQRQLPGLRGYSSRNLRNMR